MPHAQRGWGVSLCVCVCVCVSTYGSVYNIHISKPNILTLAPATCLILPPATCPFTSPATSHQPSHHHRHRHRHRGGGVVSYSEKDLFGGSPGLTRQLLVNLCRGSWWGLFACFKAITSRQGPRMREIRVWSPSMREIRVLRPRMREIPPSDGL